MTGRPDNNPVWHRTTILIRADLLERAQAHKTDISGVCNQALADLLNIDLCQQPLASQPAPVPIMVAPDGSPKRPGKPAREPPIPLHPVINADDPAAVTNVKRAKKILPVPTAKVPNTEPSRDEPRIELEQIQEVPPTPQSPAKEKKPVAGKRRKEEVIKKFIAEKVSRGEPDDATVPKDEMYDLFARWCRDRKIVPVPERRRFTLALKNQFALAERTADSVPCWMNIRIK